MAATEQTSEFDEQTENTVDESTTEQVPADRRLLIVAATKEAAYQFVFGCFAAVGRSLEENYHLPFQCQQVTHFNLRDDDPLSKDLVQQLLIAFSNPWSRTLSLGQEAMGQKPDLPRPDFDKSIRAVLGGSIVEELKQSYSASVFSQANPALGRRVRQAEQKLQSATGRTSESELQIDITLVGADDSKEIERALKGEVSSDPSDPKPPHAVLIVLSCVELRSGLLANFQNAALRVPSNGRVLAFAYDHALDFLAMSDTPVDGRGARERREAAEIEMGMPEFTGDFDMSHLDLISKPQLNQAAKQDDLGAEYIEQLAEMTANRYDTQLNKTMSELRDNEYVIRSVPISLFGFDNSTGAVAVLPEPTVGRLPGDLASFPSALFSERARYLWAIAGGLNLSRTKEADFFLDTVGDWIPFNVKALILAAVLPTTGEYRDLVLWDSAFMQLE
jgi:hypothetical protein